MRIKVWGARGSIPCPGPDTVRYGGNTSCVQVTLADGGSSCSTRAPASATSAANDEPRHIHILLTHLHLDHIQGLMFFAPLFDPRNEITIWGPPTEGATLRHRIARYLSAPLTPVELRERPEPLEFRECPAGELQIGSATIRAEFVNHRGPTLGYADLRAGRDASATSPTTSPRSSARSTSSTRRGSPATRSRATPTCSCTTASTPTPSTRATSAGATPRSATR